MHMTVFVTHVDIPPVPSSVITGRGTDENGRVVTFAGDWRPMLALAEALKNEPEIPVDVPWWAVLTVEQGEA